MRQPFISFVIPVYNCADFLPFMLDSIAREVVMSRVTYEILVVDGNSSDHIRQVVAKFKHLNLTYIHLNEKKSIDFDLNFALRRAKGKYLWTLSGDDILIEGSITPIINLLSKNPNVGIFVNNSIHCDRNMNAYNFYGPYINFFDHKEKFFRISNDSELIEYFNATKTSESLFSFLSSLIVKNSDIRSKINKFESLNGSCWRYQSQLIDLILDFNVNVCLTNHFCILKRGDNDSFARNGLPYRLMISTSMWSEVIQSSKADFRIKKIMLQRVCSDLTFKSFIIVLLAINSPEDVTFFKKSFNIYSEAIATNKLLKKVIILLSSKRLKKYVFFNYLYSILRLIIKYIRFKILMIRLRTIFLITGRNML